MRNTGMLNTNQLDYCAETQYVNYSICSVRHMFSSSYFVNQYRIK